MDWRSLPDPTNFGRVAHFTGIAGQMNENNSWIRANRLGRKGLRGSVRSAVSPGSDVNYSKRPRTEAIITGRVYNTDTDGAPTQAPGERHRAG